MVAVGQDLGLRRDCSGWDIPEWEKGFRKRLAWALFMQDKRASLIHGRTSHIFQTEWAVKSLEERVFPENYADENDEEASSEVERVRTLYTCMVFLTQILSDILASLCSGASGEDVDQDQSNKITRTLIKVKHFQMRLKEWHAKLPDCLNIEYVKPRKLCSSGCLHLTYGQWKLSSTDALFALCAPA